MFYISTLNQQIHIHPSFVSKNLLKILKETLHDIVEGICTDKMIIKVLRINDIGYPLITDNGFVEFNVNYDALVMKPTKNQIIEAIVLETRKTGIFANAGPLQLFISNYHIPSIDIKKNMMVRAKIIGLKIDEDKMYAVGSLEGDCLGVIEQ
ncbi:DNA-directed RNA polymerase II subunit RPB7 [Dictyocoela muelleri]|nr:DNA-directed RNA polymerase II subunit RPB7 [Dictyocoela muelleri]